MCRIFTRWRRCRPGSCSIICYRRKGITICNRVCSHSIPVSGLIAFWQRCNRLSTGMIFCVPPFIGKDWNNRCKRSGVRRRWLSVNSPRPARTIFPPSYWRTPIHASTVSISARRHSLPPISPTIRRKMSGCWRCASTIWSVTMSRWI
ncbi:hypothetical protein Xkoz_03653 [Xenorhabdus kozodoii]|uniref:Uncharacterized protein n=1 Tax=Xenorhabdus kozodoii TaxID=351676 RepID=A0A2D0KZ10_9GAMM|nr:hypothetical protein Xkoz_03653 [Xenorhabdus kozodoii]